MNDVLFTHHYQIIEREPASKLTSISNKTVSRIKADSENAVLAPWKPRRDRMELSDFDKCETCINCKIIQIVKSYSTNKTTNYIIKKISLILGFEPLFLH